MSENNLIVRGFRVLVLALLCFFFVQNFIPSMANQDFGGNFRFLTIWGQTMSLAVGILMLARSFGMTRLVPETLVSTTVVINLVLVFLSLAALLRRPHPGERQRWCIGVVA